MNHPRGAHAMYLARHRSYSRLAAKLGLTSVQRETYRKLARHYLKKARDLRERNRHSPGGL